MAAGARQAIVETLDVPAGNDLSQAAILRVSDFHEIRIEEQHVRAIHGRALRLADKLHDNAATDVAVLVNVDGALFVAEQELLVAEAEHTERVLVREAGSDGGHVLLFEVWHAPGLFLVESHDFEALCCGDGERAVEQVDCVAVGGDVELVVFAEELGAAGLPDAGLLFCRFLVDGLEDFEGRGEPFALLVEDQCAVFHRACCEKSNIASAGQLLWRTTSGVVGGRHATDRTDSVEVVRDERFVGDEQHQAELLENGDLCHSWDLYCLSRSVKKLRWMEG